MKFRNFLLFILLLFSVFFYSCTDDDLNKTDDKDSFVFEINAVGRDKEIFVYWGNPEAKKFEKIELTLKAKKSAEFAETDEIAEYQVVTTQEPSIKKSGSFSFKDNSLYTILNGNEYLVIFAGVDSDGKKYYEELTCKPYIYKLSIERETAVLYDEKIVLSWTLDTAQQDFTEDFVVYYVDYESSVKETRLKKGEDADYSIVEEVSAYEEILEENSIDAMQSKTRDKYYTCTIYNKAYVDEFHRFHIRGFNKNNVESNECEVITRKSTLPVVEISTENKKVITNEEKESDTKINATLNLMNCSSEIKNASLTIKGRGNSSWLNSPKKSYTLKFSEKQSVLDMKEHKSYALVANYFDKSLMRNVFAYQMGRNFFTNMSWNPDAKSVHLFLNGVYQGIYAFTQTNKIDKNRVNIPNLEKYDIANDTDGSDFYNYGYLLEANDRADENFNFDTSQNLSQENSSQENPLTFSLKEPDGADISDDVKEKIKTEILKREAALFSDDWLTENSENFWKNYFDEASFIDWYLIEEFARNVDSNYFSSCYIYFDPNDKKIHAGPIWDFDLGFGNMRDTPEANTTEELQKVCITAKGPWLSRMLEDFSFKENAKSRWAELLPKIQEYLPIAFPESSTEILNVLKIPKYEADLNFARWPILGKKIWKSPSFCENHESYDDEVNCFKNWLNERTEWMNNWLNQ